MPAGVPDSTDFAMSDVVAEIGSGDDLVELFALATGTFDPAYVGDKTNLLNFRNYVHSIPLGEFISEPFDSVGSWALISSTIAGGLLDLEAELGDATNLDYGNLAPIGTNVRITVIPTSGSPTDSTVISYNGVTNIWASQDPLIIEGITTDQLGFNIKNQKTGSLSKGINGFTVEAI